MSDEVKKQLEESMKQIQKLQSQLYRASVQIQANKQMLTEQIDAMCASRSNLILVQQANNELATELETKKSMLIASSQKVAELTNDVNKLTAKLHDLKNPTKPAPDEPVVDQSL